MLVESHGALFFCAGGREEGGHPRHHHGHPGGLRHPDRPEGAQPVCWRAAASGPGEVWGRLPAVCSLLNGAQIMAFSPSPTFSV